MPIVFLEQWYEPLSLEYSLGHGHMRREDVIPNPRESMMQSNLNGSVNKRRWSERDCYVLRRPGIGATIVLSIGQSPENRWLVTNLPSQWFAINGPEKGQRVRGRNPAGRCQRLHEPCKQFSDWWVTGCCYCWRRLPWSPDPCSTSEIYQLIVSHRKAIDFVSQNTFNSFSAPVY